MRPDRAWDFDKLIKRAEFICQTVIPISASQFKKEHKERQERLLGLPGYENVAQNILLPCLLPPTPDGGMGDNNVVTFYLPILERGYHLAFPDRSFRPGFLSARKYLLGEISLLENVGWQSTNTWRSFCYIPDCLRLPVDIQRRVLSREMIQMGFSLGGVHDGFPALGLHAEILTGRKEDPGVDFSALNIRAPIMEEIKGVGEEPGEPGEDKETDNWIYAGENEDCLELDITSVTGATPMTCSGALSFM
jgi:hypothetical protein